MKKFKFTITTIIEAKTQKEAERYIEVISHDGELLFLSDNQVEEVK
jgi:predicted 3-demethylubiquinone-9 3-methyltransferase (glyoxalase superfamily)